MPADRPSAFRASVEIALPPSAVFDLLVEELVPALAARGIGTEPREGGSLTADGREVGVVVAWERPARILAEWRGADWDPDSATELELRFDPAEGGTLVVLEHRGWGPVVGEADELAGWFAGQAIAPLLRAMTPIALGDWVADRAARRPSGARARGIYRDPLYHYPNFRVILAELALGPDDYLLDVGCGGGAMLREALATGCRAAGVDHSREMVALAREVNRDAVAEGRLDVREASAERLPFPDSTFTHAAMTGVLGFLSDPVAALAEIQRVLREGGRLVALGSDPRWRGTPAAPEPIASRLRFYEDDELAGLARAAGFDEARVVRRDLEPFAREVAVPEEHLPLFAGAGAPFVLARKR